MTNTYSITISNTVFGPPVFTGYFTVENGIIISFYDNATSSSCLLPGNYIYDINLPGVSYQNADNLFNEVTLRFSFNGVIIQSKALQNNFKISDNDIFNIFSYSSTRYDFSSYLQLHTKDETGKDFPLWSAGNILYHFNDIYAYIKIAKINI